MLAERPWKLESTVRLLLAVFVCFFIGLAVAEAVRLYSGAGERSIAAMLIATLSFQGAALVLIHRFLRAHEITWTEAFGLKSGPALAVLFGVLAALAVLPIGWLLQWLSAHALHLVHLQPQEQQAVQALRAIESWADRIFLGVAAILFAPVAEELLFRGVLYPAIKQTGRPRLALWGTAITFALIHQNLAALVPLTFLAIVLTLLYEKTNNLLAPIVAHSLFNAANFLVLHLFLQEPGQTAWWP